MSPPDPQRQFGMSALGADRGRHDLERHSVDVVLGSDRFSAPTLFYARVSQSDPGAAHCTPGTALDAVTPGVPATGRFDRPRSALVGSWRALAVGSVEGQATLDGAIADQTRRARNILFEGCRCDRLGGWAARRFTLNLFH